MNKMPEIKDGYVVETVNGELYLACHDDRDKIIFCRGNGFNEFDEYDEFGNIADWQLSGLDKYNIINIFGRSFGEFACQISKANRPLLWTRQEPLTAKDIIKALKPLGRSAEELAELLKDSCSFCKINGTIHCHNLTECKKNISFFIEQVWDE